MYSTLQYQNAENTIILADRGDGTSIVIEEGDAQWNDAVAGHLGGVVASFVPRDPAVVLLAAQLEAQAQVDLVVDLYRRNFITEIAGQQQTYKDKKLEAEQYSAQPSPVADLSSYPYIADEAADRGVDAQVVVDEYLEMADGAKTINVPLETLRTGTKRRVRAASDIVGVEAEMASFSAALSAL